MNPSILLRQSGVLLGLTIDFGLSETSPETTRPGQAVQG